MNEYGELINEELLMKKGFLTDGKINERYKKLYRNYKILLGKFFDMKFGLYKYDNMLSSSEYKFIPVKDEDKDFYQYYAFSNLKYIYLRNNVCVEKLSDEDIERILNCTEEELDNPSKELLEIIERTYLTVLDSRIGEEAEMNCYGFNEKEYRFFSDVIVFGIRYDEYANDEEGWLDNNCKQMVVLNQVLDKMKEDMEKILPGRVGFILYDEYNVNPNMNRFIK